MDVVKQQVLDTIAYLFEISTSYDNEMFLTKVRVDSDPKGIRGKIGKDVETLDTLAPFLVLDVFVATFEYAVSKERPALGHPSALESKLKVPFCLVLFYSSALMSVHSHERKWTHLKQIIGERAIYSQPLQNVAFRIHLYHDFRHRCIKSSQALLSSCAPQPAS